MPEPRTVELVELLARYLPDDPAVVGLDEESVMATLEALGLVTAVQNGWRRQRGLVPWVKKPRKLAGSVWAQSGELTAYLEMAIDEGRARGHQWQTKVPEIAERIAEPARPMMLFVLGASLYDPTDGTLDEEYLFDAFAQRFGADSAAVLREVAAYYRDRFDYPRALEGIQELGLAPDPDHDLAETRDGFLRSLAQLGMLVAGTRTLDSETLAELPAHRVIALFDDHETTATLYVIPDDRITGELGRAAELADPELCFAGPDDLEDEQWLAVCRLLAALGENVEDHYDEWLGPFCHLPACPSRAELAALRGAWSDYCCVLFQDGSRASTRRADPGRLDTRLTGLLVLNWAM